MRVLRKASARALTKRWWSLLRLATRGALAASLLARSGRGLFVNVPAAFTSDVEEVLSAQRWASTEQVKLEETISHLKEKKERICFVFLWYGAGSMCLLFPHRTATSGSFLKCLLRKFSDWLSNPCSVNRNIPVVSQALRTEFSAKSSFVLIALRLITGSEKYMPTF